MLDWWEKNFATCELGDHRLNERTMSIGYALSKGFGKALSKIFSGATVLIPQLFAPTNTVRV
ncbi:IS4/Tn5 family transposase DNA-binding protein [Nostoc sp.]|uniref:IS4/Tn5 family transposase DNA-binding protein n=1 Tax=Nostoc sp. TaxID=1180 RepID=UPI002FFB15B1